MEAEVVDDVERKPRFNTDDQDGNWSPLYYGELEAEVDLSPVAVIQLQIFSNWGHLNRRVGLTEVQFLDENRQPLLVESAKPGGSKPLENEKGDLHNLFNGKTKTVKDKFMWSCDLRVNTEPIELLFFVRTLCERSITRTVRWMGIWNFNKGLKDLDVGAKAVRIIVNGSVSFEGILEKGCGNQVFEYGQFLLLDVPQPEVKPPFAAFRDQIKQGNKNIMKNVVDDDDNIFVPERRLSPMLRSRALSLTSALDFGSSSISKPNSACDEQRKWDSRRPSWLDEFQYHDNVSEQNQSLPPWLKDHEDLKDTFERPADEQSGRTTRNLFLSCSRQSSASQFTERNVSLDDSGTSRGGDESLPKVSFDYPRKSPPHETSARFGRRAISASSARLTNRNAAKVTSSGSLHFRGAPSSLEAIKSSLSFQDAKKNERDFVIPELPEGRQLVINIRSTWGDRHYVGLNGIELFASCGMPVPVSKIWAEPADINVLPEYSQDPRVVTNLINGVYRTKDDANLWLAPFTPGKDHFIYVTFGKRVKVALIRVWNYNKSRIHSYRGARYMEMSLDGLCIFKGEIAKACGAIVGETETFGDTILFTLDDYILEYIARNDINFLPHEEMDNEDAFGDIIDRPPTGNCGSNSNARPRTTSAIQSCTQDNEEDAIKPRISGLQLELCLCSNWGDTTCIGLTGIEVVGEDEEVLDLGSCVVTLSKTSIEGACIQKEWNQSLSRLYDGSNVTTDVQHMWMTSFDDSPVTICITLEDRHAMTGLRLWNYNASLEESYCGVRLLVVKIDGQLISPSMDGYLVRRAPGNCHFDFNQFVSFTSTCAYSELGMYSGLDNIGNWPPSRTSSSSSYEEYEPPVMPKGFVFQLQLLSTWGDSYYVGLNGLQMYDALGNTIALSEGEVAAYPDSVNVLEGITDDVRTPDKLVDGVNDTHDGRHTWLSPILPGIINRVYVIFDYPVTVSMIKLWNYAKSPSRGVKEFAVVVDDLLVYHGVLTKTGSTVSHQTVLFTADTKILDMEKQMAIRNEGIGQDVQMTNDSQIVHKSRSNDPIDQALRPFTSLPPKTVLKCGRQVQGFIH